jgi:APA family basic amino acid/polyamine antiporter
VINGIIGTAVFILPGTLGGKLGWLSLVAWVVAAMLSGSIILCFAEVASRFSGTGGAYLFTQAAFGRFVGLQIGWVSYFVRIITGAVQSNLFATYLAEFWPWAGSRAGGVLVTGLFLGLLAGVNVRGVLSGAHLSNAFAVVKIAPLLTLGFLGVIWLSTQDAIAQHTPATTTFSGWLQALLLLMFAYGGFESAVIPLAEAKAPRRDAPSALLIGLGLAAVVYLAAQVTVLATLSSPVSSSRPLADSARVMLGGWGAALITLAALISVYGWLSSNMLAVPRLSMALADSGDFPKFFSRIHPVFRTPWISIIVFAGLSWVLANLAGLLQNLSLAAVSRLFTYGLVCAALPALRRKERRHITGVAPALFRVPGGAVLAAVGMAGSILLVSRMSAREALTMAAVFGLATMHYIGGRNSRAGTP